jgi:hypothetical protein
MNRNLKIITLGMSLLFFHSIFAFHAGDLVSYTDRIEGRTVGIIEKILSKKQVVVRQALHGSRKGAKISDGSGNRLFGINIASLDDLEYASSIKSKLIKFRTHTKGMNAYKIARVIQSYNTILLTTESENCATLFNIDKIDFFNEINDCNSQIVSKKDLL